MNLIPVEWSEAQDVLLKLVQTLTPWTIQEIPASFFLSKRFAYPFKDRDQSPQIRSSVKLLNVLKSAQELVDQWADEREEASLIEKNVEPTPFPKQAQRMIVQVHEAIGKMVSSEHLKEPKEEPLRLALKQLKPQLDQLIETVSKEGVHSPKKSFPPLPVSRREELFQKIAQKRERLDLEPQLQNRGIFKSVGESHSPAPQINEKKILPIVPFIPQIKPPLLADKKRKKRKGFWFRKEENDPETTR